MPRTATVMDRVEDVQPGANTDVFDDDLAVSEAEDGMQVMVLLASGAVLSRMVTRTDDTTVAAALNDDSALTAGAEFNFALPADPAHSYNFQIESDVTIEYLSVKRVSNPTI